MNTVQEDRRSLSLLLSIVLFFCSGSATGRHGIGELILIFPLFILLVASIVELSAKRVLMRFAVPLVIVSMVFILLGHFRPTPLMAIANFSLLTVFFGLVSVGLFIYLGRTGSITSGRVYASVSLYLILGLFWFAIYNVLNVLSPNSFLETGLGPSQIAHIPRATFLYFSMVTLTTLGYGDIVPPSPVPRMFASLESATGVLYIAITVARRVASYQITDDKLTPLPTPLPVNAK
jgi:voltage-gated potassium channel Kch